MATATTVEVQAKLSLVDQLTGRLSQVASSVRGFHDKLIQDNKRAQSALSNPLGAGAAAANGWGGKLAGLATGYAATHIIHGQVEIDRQLRQAQTMGNATEEQREGLRKLVMELGPKLAMSQTELIHGAGELMTSGIKFQDLFYYNPTDEKKVTLFERMAQIAKVGNEPMEHFAANMTAVANSFNMPFATGEDRMKAWERVSNVMLMARRVSLDKPSEHATALRIFGPQANMLHMPIEEASALQAVLSEGGNKGSFGGQALKTILSRFTNPTFGSSQQLAYYGFDYSKVMGLDIGHVDVDKMLAGMTAGGFQGATHYKGIVNRVVEKHAGKHDVFAFENELMTELEGAAKVAGDLKLGSKWKRGLIKRGVHNAVMGTRHTFDLMAFLEELQKIPVHAFAELFGLHHASKAEELATERHRQQWISIVKRYRDEQERVRQQGLDIKTDPNSLSYQWDKLGSGLVSLQSKLFSETDTGGGIVGGFAALNAQIERLLKMDGSQLNGIIAPLLALAGTAAGIMALGVALAGLVKSVAIISEAAPWLLTLGSIGMEQSRAQSAAAAFANRPDKTQLPDEMKPWAWRAWDFGKRLFTGNGGAMPLSEQGVQAMGLDVAPLGSRPDIKAQLEGFGTVTVKVEIEDQTRLGGISARIGKMLVDDDGKNLKLKAGDSMPDAGR